MEVEAESLRGYDVQSRCSPPFALNLDVGSQECASSELFIASRPDLEPVGVVVEDHVESSQPHRVSLDPDVESLVGLSPSVKSTEMNGQISANFVSTAALKLQKFYRSYRTRRRLADSAVVAEELWWQVIDFVRLNHSTISFFNFEKPETAASRWNRVSLNASKVGKGLSKDGKALKLAFQHWIEAIDPRHRYGHNLHLYYEEWCKTESEQPFFFWLDIGNGKLVDLKDCARSKLRKQCIKYLGPQEREHYEYVVVGGKIMHKLTETLLDTDKISQGAKWIFVMSTSKKLYAGEKKKGVFHHSSFLAGGATLAAGRLGTHVGVLKSISAYSGHYRPTGDLLDSFLNFLKENGVNLNEVQVRYSEDYENYDDGKSIQDKNAAGAPKDSEPSLSKIASNLYEDQPNEPAEVVKTKPAEVVKTEPAEAAQNEPTEVTQTESKGSYQRTSSIGVQQSPRAEVPKKAILQRINSKKAARSYQLGHQLSLKWSTGAGPRIGCVADYPMELRVQALEFVQLSPRTPATPPTPSSFRQLGSLLSPKPRSTILLSPKPHPTSIVCNGNSSVV